jgi:2-keto-4-pentenoate hydratase/2-oxohepta-3-ene-1,7-dioic acid hydratase in catechol pathway
MRLGSLLRNGRACAALACGDRALVLTELVGLDPARYGAFASAADATLLWSQGSGSVLSEIARRLSESGIPSGWEACCEPAGTCHWLPPVPSPEKIICIGLNYRDHAAESGMQVPTEPVFFNKYNNALTGASGPIVLPCNSHQVDFEAELAVIIGKQAKRVSVTQALEYVAGYTVMHDVSARDWQFRTGQWISGKTFDSFGPCGPYLVTRDEVPDPHKLGIRLTLNGKVMQDSNTCNLIFQVPVLVSYLSQIVTLKPGDIISTGTPPGIGAARNPKVFLQDGDLVEITVEHVGTIRHRCVAEAPIKQVKGNSSTGDREER